MSSPPLPAVHAPLSLVDAETRPGDVPRANRVYVNRNLSLDRIDLVGFDMDYTLALYNQPKIEELSMRATLHKLCTNKDYPGAIRHVPSDPALAIRGLVIDRQHGNVFKPDRYGSPGRAVHGRTPLDKGAVRDLYFRERMSLASERYAWIDSLFALPEAVLYAVLVDFFDHHPGPKPGYDRLWLDIRESIDLAHRDGSIKAVVGADLLAYVERDPALAETLHKFRSSGKRLFLLTNSAWDYTDPVMRFLLDGVLPAYPSWRNYFDIVVVSAAKPAFFTEENPFVELDPEGNPSGRAPGAALSRSRVYAGGNLKEFQKRAKASGDSVLYVGDHIYGDMLRSRKSSSWRTAMVLQELEHEVATHDAQAAALGRLDRLDAELGHLDSEINERHGALKALPKADADLGGDRNGGGGRREIKETIDRLRAELRTVTAQHRQLEAEIDHSFNPTWGAMFREGNEISKFGEQLEAYACVYTSRVSNFRFYSPMQHFRGPRDRMPHER